MSLVICSNREDQHGFDRRSHNNAPYSFTNSLKQTMIIPPESYVSLQSIKINKDGLQKLHPADAWFCYFGRNLVETDTHSSLTPYLAIRGRPELTNNNLAEDVSIDVWVERIARGFNRAVPHPDYYGNITFTIERTGGLGFLGYRLNVDYDGDQSATNNLQDAWQSAYLLEDGLDYDHVLKRLTGKTGSATSTAHFGPVDENTNIYTGQPISHNGGEFEVDITGLQNAKGHYNTHWQVGLNRAITGVASPWNQNTYFNAHNSDGFIQNGFNENQFDYVISCDQDVIGGDRFLKVHCMMRDEGFNRTCMRELDYWGFVGNNFGGNKYNMSTNANNFDTLGFKIENEIVTIRIKAGAGPWLDIVKFGMLGIGKDNLPKPAAQTCWNLYPKVTILGGNTNHVTLNKIGGKIPTYDNWNYESVNSDWCNRMAAEGLEGNVMMDLDTGFWNDLGSATDYEQKGITPVTFRMTDCDVQTVTYPSLRYFAGTGDANMSAKWGFQTRDILSVTSGATAKGARGFYWVSDQVPEITSTSSLFVRLDDLTQKSVNAGVGRPSKIIYHLPRFDNSNREVGNGLYYEPGQRTYLALDNSEPLHINDLKISICNENEMLAKDLNGKTIICLHVISSKEKNKLDEDPQYRGKDVVLRV